MKIPEVISKYQIYFIECYHSHISIIIACHGLPQLVCLALAPSAQTNGAKHSELAEDNASIKINDHCCGSPRKRDD